MVFTISRLEYIYIYIYIERERERERGCEKSVKKTGRRYNKQQPETLPIFSSLSSFPSACASLYFSPHKIELY
jgi:hypothetical protein